MKCLAVYRLWHGFPQSRSWPHLIDSANKETDESKRDTSSTYSETDNMDTFYRPKAMHASRACVTSDLTESGKTLRQCNAIYIIIYYMEEVLLSRFLQRTKRKLVDLIHVPQSHGTP